MKCTFFAPKKFCNYNFCCINLKYSTNKKSSDLSDNSFTPTDQLNNSTAIESETEKTKSPFNPNPSILPTSSVPQEVFKDRIALIFRPTRNVMQSGRSQSQHWCLQFNSDVPRWENPIMGWTSSRDPVQSLNLKFESKEEAKKYAEEQGWAFEVKEYEEIPLRPKNYAENFLYSTKKLKIIKTK